ncbi:MAG: endonuclease/exonuclease/phosphatase family protein [Acidobacteriota bacterium]
MRIATWNVNGIRARQQQVLEWITSDKPDILALQELKAPRDKVPDSLSEMEDYWCYWHGERAYSGVGLLIRRNLSPEKPGFAHPEFDFETRIVTARLGNLVVNYTFSKRCGTMPQRAVNRAWILFCAAI